MSRFNPHFLFGTDIHKDNVRPDLFDIIVADNDITCRTEQVADLEPLGDKEFVDLAGTVIEFDVRYVADLFTGLDIDDFLFLKLGKQHKDTLLFLLTYHMICGRSKRVIIFVFFSE